jgi:hypothetical protein
MPIPLNGVVELTVRGTLLNQTFLSIFHYRVATQSTIQSVPLESLQFAQHMATIAPGSFIQSYADLIPSNATVLEVRAQEIFPLRWAPRSVPLSLPGSGLGTTVSNLSAVITKRTDLAGRKFRGSVHVPLSPANVADGEVNAGYKALMVAFSADLVSAQTVATGGGVYQPAIYHRFDPNNPSTDVVEGLPQDTARVMRRRTVGLGI